MPLASLVRPPARHHPVAGFRSPSFRPPCIHEAHFRHRAASVSGFLRPSATVAAWHPGPAAPVRGKASIPPVCVSTGSGATICRDLPGFASACVHPCPMGNGSPHKFLPRSSASTGPASFLADPDHASPFSRQPDCQKKPPPRLKYQSRSRPDRRHARFRQTPRRRISDNAIYV